MPTKSKRRNDIAISRKNKFFDSRLYKARIIIKIIDILFSDTSLSWIVGPMINRYAEKIDTPDKIYMNKII
jgi:hypothetical protein